MKCISCGGTLKFNGSIYICENCEANQTVSHAFEKTEVFLCYIENDYQGRRSHDSIIAQEVYGKLEAAKVHTFYSRISAADLTEENYDVACTTAFDHAKIIAVIASSAENFKLLLDEYGDCLDDKHIVPIYIDMNANDIPEKLARYQAVNYEKVGASVDFIKGVLCVLGKENEIDILETSKRHRSRKKQFIVILICIAATAAVAVFSYIVFDTPYVLKSKKYEYAQKMMEEKNYIKAIDICTSVKDDKNAQSILSDVYNVYEGYYQNDTTLTLHLNIDQRQNANIDIRQVVNGDSFQYNATVSVNKNIIEFRFSDYTGASGQGKIELSNEDINLKIKMDNISEAERNTTANFKISNKSDKPIMPKIDKAKILEWLSSPKHENDLRNEGYELVSEEHMTKFDTMQKRIANTDIVICVNYEPYITVNYNMPDYMEYNLDNGLIYGIQAPASIVCPEHIGKSIQPITEGDVIYYPAEIPSGVAGNFQPLDLDTNIKYIEDDTMVSVTSKQWLEENKVGQ